MAKKFSYRAFEELQKKCWARNVTKHLLYNQSGNFYIPNFMSQEISFPLTCYSAKLFNTVVNRGARA